MEKPVPRSQAFACVVSTPRPPDAIEPLLPWMAARRSERRQAARGGGTGQVTKGDSTNKNDG